MIIISLGVVAAGKDDGEEKENQKMAVEVLRRFYGWKWIARLIRD